MKRITNILILIAVLLALAGCTKEIKGVDPLSGAVTISLSMPEADTQNNSRATDIEIAETKISDVKVLFYTGSPATLASIATPGVGGVEVNTEKTLVTIPKGFVNLNTPYKIVVLANVEGKTLTAFNPTDKQAYSELNQAYSTSPAASPFTMSGETATDHIFSQQNIARVSLKRQAVKFDVTVLFDASFLTAYANKLYFKDVTLTANNLPDRSWVFGDPDAARFNTLSSMKLSDYTPIAMTSNTLAPSNPATISSSWNSVLYGYENLVSGQTESDKKRATNFILKVPYSLDGGTTMVTDNYYKVAIDQPTAADLRYQTKRNHCYAITVTIKGLGSPVPQLNGLDVETNVVPWDAVSRPIATPETPLVELTNTECQIYGDIVDGSCVIAKVRLKGKGVKIEGQLATGSTNITVPTSKITLSSDVSTDIVIQPLSPFDRHVVTLTVEGKDYPITVSAQFDPKPITISNVNLSSAPTGGFVTATQQGANLQLTTSKVSLGDVRRISECFCTTTSTPTSVVKVIIVQEPYVTVGATKWATGNVAIGQHPFTGELCYVIGSAREQGLLFQFRSHYGFEFEDKPNSAPWVNNVSVYYVPGLVGNVTMATRRTSPNWETVYDVIQLGYRSPEVNDPTPPDPMTDPCTYVYSSDPTIKWKTPTNADMDKLWKDGIVDNTTIKGFYSKDGKLFFKNAGRRNGGRGKSGNIENANTSACYATSTVAKVDQFAKSRDYAHGWVLITNIGGDTYTSRIQSTSNSIRCVRAN
ncbi:MAG: hypothetical protein RSB32_03310 [Mucinivorans sp.]